MFVADIEKHENLAEDSNQNVLFLWKDAFTENHPSFKMYLVTITSKDTWIYLSK